MQSIYRSILLVTGLSLAASSNAFADLVTNGGFESGDFSGWTQGGNYSSFNSYTAVVPSDPGNGYYVNTGGYAAAAGPNGSPGTLSQSFADTAGQAYDLTFALHGDAKDGFTDNFFSAVVGSGGGAGTLSLIDVTGPYQLYNVSFVGSGLDTLLFTFENNDNYLGLDDVGIAAANGSVDPGPGSSLPSPLPEPSGLVLLGTGTLAVAGLARRRLLRF